MRDKLVVNFEKYQCSHGKFKKYKQIELICLYAMSTFKQGCFYIMFKIQEIYIYNI